MRILKEPALLKVKYINKHPSKNQIKQWINKVNIQSKKNDHIIISKEHTLHPY